MALASLGLTVAVPLVSMLGSSPSSHFFTDLPHSQPRVMATPRLTPGVGVKYSVPNRPEVQLPEAKRPWMGL